MAAVFLKREMDSLRQQVMVNQFVYVTGCHSEQAKQYLVSSNWHFEMALSMFFQESTVPPCSNTNGNYPACHYPISTPTNTPVTPPSFPDTLASFSKLLSSEKLVPHSTIYPSASLSQGGTQPHTLNTEVHQ